MRSFGRPDFAVLKPEKDVRRNHPGREGNRDLQCVARPYLQRIQHGKILPWDAAIIFLTYRGSRPCVRGMRKLLGPPRIPTYLFDMYEY